MMAKTKFCSLAYTFPYMQCVLVNIHKYFQIISFQTDLATIICGLAMSLLDCCNMLSVTLSSWASARACRANTER